MEIYLVHCKVNGKYYVGQSVGTAKQRMKDHIKDARPGQSDLLIHRAMRCHGVENFTCTTIGVCDTEEELNIAEKFMVWLLNSANPDYGYNLTLGGQPGRPNKATKEKISKTRIYLCASLSIEDKQEMTAAGRAEIQVLRSQGVRMGGQVEGKPAPPRSDATRRLQSDLAKLRPANPNFTTKGRKPSEEENSRRSESNRVAANAVWATKSEEEKQERMKNARKAVGPWSEERKVNQAERMRLRNLNGTAGKQVTVEKREQKAILLTAIQEMHRWHLSLTAPQPRPITGAK